MGGILSKAVGVFNTQKNRFGTAKYLPQKIATQPEKKSNFLLSAQQPLQEIRLLLALSGTEPAIFR